MRILTNTKHKFNLNGFYAGDTFLGCNNCWWRAERGEVMKPICPECGKQLYAYCVRQDDL
jgi:ssDNA-binding Zn-finger/Zn-ribbon topoisomerase 1